MKREGKRNSCPREEKKILQGTRRFIPLGGHESCSLFHSETEESPTSVHMHRLLKTKFCVTNSSSPYWKQSPSLHKALLPAGLVGCEGKNPPEIATTGTPACNVKPSHIYYPRLLDFLPCRLAESVTRQSTWPHHPFSSSLRPTLSLFLRLLK